MSQHPATVKGTITTTDGKPAPFVNITIRGAKKATMTDENGHFSFDNLKPCSCTLIISHTGLQSQEKAITIDEGQTLDLQLTLQETAKQLDEVVVNGHRTLNERPVSIGKANISPLDLPQTVGVVSNTVINDQQASRLGDVVKNVSGVSLTQQRQGVAETFSARGYSIGIGGAGGSIFKNGIMVNTQGFPEVSTLESIEVMKGSTALLYGNTSGGVIINMVTKKPKFTPGGEISMRYGSYDLYKPIVDLYGPLSKNLAYRVVGTYEHARSYRDQVKNRRAYVNPSFLYKLGKKTTILVQGDYLDANFTPDNGIGMLNLNIDAVIPDSRSRFINTAWAYYKSKQASGSVNIDHTLNDQWKLNFIAGLQATDINAFGTGVPNTIAKNGDWARALARTKTSEDDYTVQLNLNGQFKTGRIKHQLLVGTDYVRVVTKSYGFRITSSNGVVGTAYDTINILTPAKFSPRTDMPDARDTALVRTPSFRLGYYVQDLISITDKVKVLAGLRWSYLKNNPVTTSNFVKQTETKTAIVDNRAFSPKVALIYQPVKTTSIFVSYANNFTTNTGTDINGKPLDPSIIDQYELGVKNIFFDGKLAANFSIYRIQNSNLAQMALVDKNGNPNTNANIKEFTGQTKSDGFEVDINGNLSRNFYFIAGYAFNNARYTKSSNDSAGVVPGEKLNNNPRHTANATLFYTFSAGTLRGLKLGAAAFYTGDRMGGNQNTIGQKPQFNRQVPLSGFTTIDLSAGYTFHRVSLLAKLSNITNVLNYLAHDRYSINPIPPRQFAVTASYAF